MKDNFKLIIVIIGIFTVAILSGVLFGNIIGFIVR